MKLKNIIYSTLAASLLAVSTSASAVLIMVGDNDGYGYALADGATLPATATPGCSWCFDNRSGAELVATDGAQYTDFEAPVAPVSFNIGFDASLYTSISNVIFTIDVTGIQANAFGASTLLLVGVDVSAAINAVDQGAWGSGVYTFGVNSADLLDGSLNVSFTGGANDHVGFDFFSLSFDGRSSVPEPTILGMLGLGVALFGFSRKRKVA